MTIDEFVDDDEINNDLGDLLERYAKVDEIVNHYARSYHGDADVSNEAMELLRVMQEAAIRMVVKRWQQLNEWEREGASAQLKSEKLEVKE